MEQDLRDEGTAKSQHVVHVLPSDDQRIAAIVRSHVERISIEESEGPALRLLVLVPSAEDTARLAGAVNDGLDGAGALLTPVANTTRGARRIALGARAAVTSPGLVRDLLRQSAIKLDGVQGVVLLHLDTLIGPDGSAVDEILAEFPKGADRVAVTETLNPTVDAFLERHARRARRMQYDAPAGSEAKLQYVVSDRGGRARVLSQLLDTLDPAHATVVASDEDAEAACAALAHLGYGPEDPMVSFSDGEIPEGQDLVVLYTAPADVEDLQPISDAGAARVIAMVAPEELTAFLRVFGHSAAAALPQAPVQRAKGVVHDLREKARTVLSAQSLHHQLLALAPLFAEREPAEVAAALLALLERQELVAAPAGTSQAVLHLEAHSARPAREERGDRAPARPRDRSERPERGRGSGTFTPVFINVGERDGAKKGDLVGALTNEGGISSELLGKITMRDMHSVVEVDASVADKVIEAITGKTIRGRVVNARVDRKPEERGDRGDDRRSGGDRPMRRSPVGRGPREDSRPPRPRSREGFAGGRGGSGSGGRSGSSAGSGRSGGRDFGARGADDRRRPPRDDARGGGARPFGGGDRGSRGPRAIGESREWGERGERLQNARRPRRDHD